MTRIPSLLLAALALSACGLAPPSYQSYTPPSYPQGACAGGIYGGYLAGQGRCTSLPAYQPPAIHQTYCMPTGFGTVSCTEY